MWAAKVIPSQTSLQLQPQIHAGAGADAGAAFAGPPKPHLPFYSKQQKPAFKFKCQHTNPSPSIRVSSTTTPVLPFGRVFLSTLSFTFDSLTLPLRPGPSIYTRTQPLYSSGIRSRHPVAIAKYFCCELIKQLQLQMGNGASSSILSGNKTAKVIDAQGKMRKVELPAKAAEIMLEEPGHIICGVEELKRARRVVAMRADDELLVGKVYALVPIGRVHCRVTDADMAVIKAACCSRKKNRNGAKVLPDVTVTEEEKCAKGIAPVCGYRIGNSRPWIPVLESIPEVL